MCGGGEVLSSQPLCYEGARPLSCCPVSSRPQEQGLWGCARHATSERVLNMNEHLAGKVLALCLAHGKCWITEELGEASWERHPIPVLGATDPLGLVKTTGPVSRKVHAGVLCLMSGSLSQKPTGTLQGSRTLVSALSAVTQGLQGQTKEAILTVSRSQEHGTTELVPLPSV